jgi:hypothetical protein
VVGVEGEQPWSPSWCFRLKLLFLVYFNQMPSPEKSNPGVEITIEGQLVHHMEGGPLSTLDILAKGDPFELQKLADKYDVTKTPEETLKKTTLDESVVVTNENLSRNFPDSIIIKQTNDRYFAVRKNKNGEWEGNSFTLMSDGNIGAVYQEHILDKNIIETAEKKLELTIPLLDRELMKIGVDQEKRAEFLNELKNFTPEQTIEIYHGINGGISGALGVLESKEQGIEQRSGPCFAVYPLGSFWKPGDAGFKYSIKRGDVEFPGESKPTAQFRMDNDGVIFLTNGLNVLSLNKFNGVVMRNIEIRDVYEKDEDGNNKAISVNGEWEDLPPVKKVIGLTDEELVIEKRIQEKLKELADIRKKNNNEVDTV